MSLEKLDVKGKSTLTGKLWAHRLALRGRVGGDKDIPIVPDSRAVIDFNNPGVPVIHLKTPLSQKETEAVEKHNVVHAGSNLCRKEIVQRLIRESNHNLPKELRRRHKF